MSSSSQEEEVQSEGFETTFITSTQNRTSPIYFHYKVDPSKASLEVEVLGPNLSFTFSHLRARRFISASGLANQMKNKTVGFLAVVRNDGKRVVLASAQSGHGSGKFGELLDPTPGVLPNKIWTRRVITIGKILGLNMRNPFDSGSVLQPKPEHEGLFLGSHVEVKLAVHAICVLLKVFNITNDFNSITRRDLKRLKRACLQIIGQPVFEIYFSRKECNPCKNLVQKLEELTGVTLRLC